MGRKPNRKRNYVARSLMRELASSDNILNLRACMIEIAKKHRVSLTYVRNVWYNFVAPYDKETGKTQISEKALSIIPKKSSGNVDNTYCFYSTGALSKKMFLNRKSNTKSVKYTGVQAANKISIRKHA